MITTARETVSRLEVLMRDPTLSAEESLAQVSAWNLLRHVLEAFEKGESCAIVPSKGP